MFDGGQMYSIGKDHKVYKLCVRDNVAGCFPS